MSTPQSASSPTPIIFHDIRTYDGETTGKHIILLKPDASKAELLAMLSPMNHYIVAGTCKNVW